MTVIRRISLLTLFALPLLTGCTQDAIEPAAPPNPFLVGLNEALAYGDITAEHVTEYAEIILQRSEEQLAALPRSAGPLGEALAL